MDTEQLISHSRVRFEHAAAKRLLKEKYQGKMIFAHAGGMWRAGPELLTTCLACPTADGVLLDLYENPIKVNIRELYGQAQERWQEQMTAWEIEYQELSRKR